MKLNEISAELIDEMLTLYPIRGILKFKTLQNVDTWHNGEVAFHSSKGWFYFFKSNLKEAKRFFFNDFENDIVEIKQTKLGYIYTFLDNNTILFFKRKGRQGYLQTWGVSMNFSNSINKSDRHGFLLSKGVECFVRKFVIPYKNGEMRIGHWHEEYITATDYSEIKP